MLATMTVSTSDPAGKAADGQRKSPWPKEISGSGEFVRQRNHFTDRITADGSTPYPVESGRYHLIVSLACPWAHRAVIVRRLLGLTGHLSMTVVDPIRDEKGWRFTDSPDGKDPVTGAEYLSELYRASDPDFTGRVTVPTVYDTKTERVVTNDFPQIVLDLATEWREVQPPGAPDLHPEPLRAEIEELAGVIYTDVNNGVYRCGFATTQDAYERAYHQLFARLDSLTERLRDRRFLMGDQLTSADVRLFTTLVRFDAVYHGHFKCNRNKLAEMPVLWAYARDLYQLPGFGDTTDLDQIKRHYYGTHPHINPSGIVPAGPDPSGWALPHGRDDLGPTPDLSVAQASAERS
jgi:putative glutathione S-transferase